MVEKIIWPAYFDADRSRTEGRRVPLDLAVDSPELDEIAKSVQQVGYDAVIERDVAYPRDPFERTGRVRVREADDSTKNDLVQAIAAYIGAIRG